jgi:hypothetical protein
MSRMWGVLKVSLGTVLLLALSLIAKPAGAQQESVAESLFRQARDEMKRGNTASACPKFAESYRLDPSIGTLLNLALCEETVGHTATAWTKLRQFLDAAPETDGRVPLARERIAKLEKQLSWVHVLVDQGGEHMIIQLDGVELREASLDVSIPIDPGLHSIRITRPSGETNETSFEARPAERLNLRLAPPLREPAPTPVVVSPKLVPSTTEPRGPSVAPSAIPMMPTPTHRERIAGIVVGGIGVAGLLTGTVFGLMAASNRDTVREQCPNHECQNQEGLDAARAGERNVTIANTAFAVGAIGVVAGGLLLWHSERSSVAASVSTNAASLSFVSVLQ